MDAIAYPFFTVRDQASHSGAEARESVQHMPGFDAHEYKSTLIGHDNTMLYLVDSFSRHPRKTYLLEGLAWPILDVQQS